MTKLYKEKNNAYLSSNSETSNNLATSRDDNKLSTSESGVNLASSGYSNTLTSSGLGNNLASSGTSSALASLGPDSNLASSGALNRLSSFGSYTNLASSGSYNTISIAGKHSVGMIAGKKGRVKGVEGTLFALTYYKDKIPVDIKVCKVGENGIKENTWYKLDEDGNFVEEGS